MRVDPNAREPQLDFHRLYAAYQDAWRGFCAEVRVWQSLLAEDQGGGRSKRVRQDAACEQRALPAVKHEP